MANLDLEALVESCLPLIERDAARRGIRVQARCQTGSMAAVGDIKRVKQILINLLSNAVKYNTDGGEILVDTLRDGDFLVLRVTDTGQGMTAEQLAELFQPFNRLGRERSGIEGTGIGLVISRRLAELMGGSLQARSEAGIGSTFLLALPIADEADTVRSDLDPSFAPLTNETARIVHYVEDNETNIEVMRGILSQRPSIEMQYSMTGREAMQQLRREPPDVILLDMNLPDIDGIELLRLLKADPLTVGIPVVVVSADALGPQIDAALDAGALRYLTKPVSVQEVLRVLDEVFEASVPHVL
jgi:CheY-like chemotaxis protein/anti-sigma regulatory factor (Ser/Thr protein kinase)